ncbi:tyrosine-type recombinase/integrase [Halomicroarcula sp. GCM10025817]|uniref:tyrosine-type recombinase/integrase n=1 Tax=Haloarcula TaxID=2237 RepID=UPI0023E759B5|nr:site-specific integrase [Halomicroarcula sp. SYNS111]
MKDEEPTSKPITEALTQKLGRSAPAVREQLNEFHDWMLARGKDPERRKGLSPSLSTNYHARIDQLFRFAIDRMELSNPTELTHEQADLLVTWLDRDEIRTRGGEPYSESSKRKFADVLQKYFAWRYDQGDIAEPWRPRINFTDGEHEHADRLNFEERWQVLREATQYGSLPAYYDTSEREREQIDGLVAQRLGKPKQDVTRKDWERADTSAKVGSLVAVGLETGVIPIEVGRARVSWYDAKRNVLKIPKEEAGKDRPTSELPLTEATGELLTSWLQERRHYEKYDGSDRIWLNRDGNPYDSKNLCYLIRRLCDEADIDHENRKIVWYSLRHNLGQSIEETEDISQARDQLRHKEIETTKQIYGESSIESRRHTLEKVNETAQRTAEEPGFNPYSDDPAVSQKREKSTGSTGGVPPKHVDVFIDDTSDERVELARKILSEEL